MNLASLRSVRGMKNTVRKEQTEEQGPMVNASLLLREIILKKPYVHEVQNDLAPQNTSWHSQPLTVPFEALRSSLRSGGSQRQ